MFELRCSEFELFCSESACKPQDQGSEVPDTWKAMEHISETFGQFSPCDPMGIDLIFNAVEYRSIVSNDSEFSCLNLEFVLAHQIELA